jgi:excisionase family DNA binding protein
MVDTSTTQFIKFANNLKINIVIRRINSVTYIDAKEHMSKQDETYLTPGQVAKLLMVSTAAVRIWAEKGEISALMTPGGHRRFLQSEVERFSKERGLKRREAPPKKLSVLIVDDDTLFAGYIEALLSKYPDAIDVEVANDGFDAGVKIHNLGPDVVLLDLMMPDLNGFEVCQRLKSSSETSGMRVIAMTGHPSSNNVERILAAGAEACVPKSIGQDELLQLIGLNRKLTESGRENKHKVNL